MKQLQLTDLKSFAPSCPTCGKTFEKEYGVAAHHWQVHGEKLGEKEFTCDNCGDTFTRQRKEDYDHNFCGEDCMYEYQSGENHQNYNSVKVPCQYCGDVCERNESHIGELGPFCDHDCYGSWLSENWSGKNNSNSTGQMIECEYCGKSKYKANYQLDGRTHFCSVGCKQKYDKENSHPADLVTAVRRSLSKHSWGKVAGDYREENPTCEWCGTNGNMKPDVHHIIPVIVGGTNDDEILMSVCRSCHERMERFVMQYPEFKPVLVE